MTLLLQALINGLMTGALIAVPAIGFSAIFAVLRYPNFAIASYATIGAFAAWWANAVAGLPVIPALAIAFAVTGVVGVVAEETALKRLRDNGALIVAIASIALNLVLENIVRFIFGNDMKGYDLPLARDLRFGELRIGPQQLQSLALSVVIMAAMFLFLRYTRFGKAMRAVADNPDLARLKGIDPARIAIVTVFLGAGLSGVGGVLIGLDTSIDPLTGYRVLLSVFAAAVLGGLGSIPGAVVGALALGIAEELALIAVPATYRTAVGFVAILIMLTFRPRGILGERAT
ncbi:branched-subunit amino acid ABC-type transport system permease component [Bosea sp. BE125]|uniref:branched-chain amino acid ABC transporter permease n=1 Tax=Bosea sp. BE125 TaxID=2817909 RepID=UPI00285BC09F|nr:branched-chain amino acid ABC transporter permease [Bosea sp. BE125]MDR6869608.1 branched-subunit amino acid ABC-type transport system permease component [Bosea sp. BE125]